MTIGRPKAPVSDRFFAKVDTSGECWLWTGSLLGNGYGRFRLPDRTVSAHRIAWELAFGQIPEGLQVLHDCDVNYEIGDITYRRCVRPEHLFVGTSADNQEDMTVKGRGRVGSRNGRWIDGRRTDQ